MKRSLQSTRRGSGGGAGGGVDEGGWWSVSFSSDGGGQGEGEGGHLTYLHFFCPIHLYPFGTIRGHRLYDNRCVMDGNGLP